MRPKPWPRKGLGEKGHVPLESVALLRPCGPLSPEAMKQSRRVPTQYALGVGKLLG
jgi:hypothetical protein